MGFRLASLRRTNVVMAPACTCIIFVKDFTIYIEYQPTVCVIIRAGDNFQTCVKQLQLMCVKVFRIFVVKNTERHANGDIFGRVRALFHNDVLNASNDCFNSDRCWFVAALHIMSTRESMEEKTDMGLQKIDMPNNFDASLNVKDKRCAPAIDILSNFEKEMCRNGTNFQQDCEEFLKMMASNAEKTNPTPAALTNGQAFPETNEITSLEGDLLNQVEAMEEDQVGPPPALVDATVSYSEAGEANRKKCLQMERRIDRLTRRLKLKQSKLCGLHTSEQVSGLLDFCMCKFVDVQSNTHSEPTMDGYLKRLKRCSEQSCVPHNSEKFVNYFGSGSRETKNGRGSAASVAPKFDVDIREHIEKISGELHAQIKAIASDFDSDVTASSSGNDSLDEETPLPPEVTEDRAKKIPLNRRAIWRWLRNRASIAYRLSWLQSHMSALEYKIHHYTEIYKKLRCTKSQVILQNATSSDQTATGSTCSSSSTPSPALSVSATSMAAVCAAATATAMTTIKSPANAHVVLNGYHGSLAAVTTALPKADVADVAVGGVSCTESDDACSRTCPLLKSKFRKRNLVRLDALHSGGSGISVAHPKYSSVRCDCVPPMTCVLCASRGAGIDLSNRHIYATLLPMQSKIALLEPTYHPVLSFPSDVSVSTHQSALLNNEDVLNVCDKTIENRTSAQMSSVKRYYANYKNTDEIRRANSEGIEFKRRKKYVRRQPNNSQNVAYGRSQLGKQRHSKLDKTLSLRKRRRKRLLSKRSKAKDNGLDESPDEGLYYKKEDVYSSQPGSPHSSHSSTVKDPTRRKRGQSFDIDNFIIPPNSTPAAVVSKPQYKEILIPTWKIVNENLIESGEINRVSIPDYILEDLSDEKVIKLHDMLELNERKKFRTNAIRHGRSRKRTDSCPETSEANTPERVASPPVSTNSESNDATIPSNVTVAFSSTVPPNQPVAATTTAAVATIMTTTNISSNKVKIPPVNKKINLDCDNSSVTEPVSAETTPYELRVFPLSDEAYKELLASHLNTKIEDVHSDVDRDNDPKPNENESRIQSPCTESTDSVLEDPDDPDWMLHNNELDRRAAAAEAMRK